MNSLNAARIKINKIDEKMIELFKERMTAVLEVLKYKKEHKMPVFDENRELELIKKNVDLLNDESLKEYYLIFLNGMLEASKKFQGDNYE